MTPETIVAPVEVFSVSVIVRQYFSTHLLHTSGYFPPWRVDLRRNMEPQSHSSCRSIAPMSSPRFLGSEAFLEAMINELFQDAADSHGTVEDGYIAPLTAQGRARMRDVWKVTGDGRALSPVDKFDMVLGLNDAQPLDHSAEPYQSAALAVRLRNAIAHYAPVDLSDDPSTMEKLLQVSGQRACASIKSMVVLKRPWAWVCGMGQRVSQGAG